MRPKFAADVRGGCLQPWIAAGVRRRRLQPITGTDRLQTMAQTRAAPFHRFDDLAAELLPESTPVLGGIDALPLGPLYTGTHITP